HARGIRPRRTSASTSERRTFSPRRGRRRDLLRPLLRTAPTPAARERRGRRCARGPPPENKPPSDRPDKPQGFGSGTVLTSSFHQARVLLLARSRCFARSRFVRRRYPSVPDRTFPTRRGCHCWHRSTER